MDLSGVVGRVGVGWAVYYWELYTGQMTDHRGIHREHTNRWYIQGGREEKGL